MTIAAIPSFPVEALPRADAPDPARGADFEAVLEAVSSRPEPDRSRPEPRAERAERTERRERAERTERTERRERADRSERTEARRAERGGEPEEPGRCEAPGEPDDAEGAEAPDGTEATAVPVVAVVAPPESEVPTEIVTEAGPGAADTAADVPTGPASAHAVTDVVVTTGAPEAEVLDAPAEGEAPTDTPETPPSGVVPATPAEPDGSGPATPATPASPALEHRSPHATEDRPVDAPAAEPESAATVPEAVAPVTEAGSPAAPMPDATFQVAEAEAPPEAPTIPAVAGTQAPAAPAAAQAVGAADRSAAARPSAAVAVEQVEAQIISLRHRPDGTYRMRFELRPPELGRVEIQVELRDGVLHARMRADQTTTGEVLRDALGDLRARLETQGMQTGTLTVDSGSAGAGERRDERAGVDAERRQAATDAGNERDEHRPTRQHEPTPSSLLDLRM